MAQTEKFKRTFEKFEKAFNKYKEIIEKYKDLNILNLFNLCVLPGT